MTPEERQFLQESVGRIPDHEEYDDYGWVVIHTLLELCHSELLYILYVNLSIMCKMYWYGFQMCYLQLPAVSLTLVFVADMKFIQ
jgi:hypothetical protein